MKWIILGAGKFLNDILDAFSSEDILIAIVLNRPWPYDNIDTKNIIDIESYNPNPDHFHFFGYQNNDKREFLKNEKFQNIKFWDLKHKKAYISNMAKSYRGNFFGACSVIAPMVSLNSFNWINRCASIGHNTIIGSFNRIQPNSAICSGCKIGDRNYIGAGSTIIENITINDDVIIGAGSVVTKNINEPGTYVGIPAKRIK